MQRQFRDGERSVLSGEVTSLPIASPTVAENPLYHCVSLQNLGLLYKRRQEDVCSGYSVPTLEYAADWDLSDGYNASRDVFTSQAALSLPFQLQSLSLNDAAIFPQCVAADNPRVLPPGGFPSTLQQSRPATCDLLYDFHGSSGQIEERSGYLPVPVPGKDMIEARCRTALCLSQQISPRLRDLRGKILMLSMDRSGSRRLQKIIEQCADEEEIDIPFSETINCVGQLMVDKFANYVLQKLVEVCNRQQVTQILSQITREKQFIDICLNKYGIRVMQKLLKNITTRDQVCLLMSALAPAVVTLVNDTNAHSVVEMCFETFSSMEIAVLYPNIIENCYTIATDKCGCRVLQTIIKSSDALFRQILINAVSRHSLALAKDCYGNYVVQFLLNLKIPEITKGVIMQLRGNFATFSCNKYGSNVVEECMKVSSTEDFVQIVLELLQNQQHHLVVLDQYGNYVVTSAFPLAKERRLTLVYNLLVGHVEKHYEQMSGHFYGKKALKRLEKQKVWLRSH